MCLCILYLACFCHMANNGNFMAGGGGEIGTHWGIRRPVGMEMEIPLK